MKPNLLVYALFPLTLTACGGSNNWIVDKILPHDKAPSDNPGTGLVVTDEMMIGEVSLPPFTVARPDADTQAKLDAVTAGTNKLRADQGLSPLINDEELNAYAAVRAKEISKHYEHKRPNGENIGNFGENIAAGHAKAGDTVKQWRRSPGHYANMINSDYKQLGVGYYRASNGEHYWVQLFNLGGEKSSYHYISPLDRTAAAAKVKEVVQYDSNGRLSLRNQTITLGQDHRITLRAPETFGWSYQTFGEITDTRGIPEAYLNLGKPFVPNDGATMQADYRGKMVGDLAQTSRVNADVAAHLDYGSARKVIDLQVENATRDKQRDTRLDFSDTLNWNGKAQRFESETGNARLYGPNGEELGGQFSRRVGSDAYRGAYGAKKVQ